MKDNTQETPKISVHKFAGQDLQIPSSQEAYVNGKDYVYWGANNLYPNFLIELRDKSPIQSAVLRRKTDYTIGDGISNQEFYPMFKGKVQTELNKMIDDYYLTNSFAINVVWSRDGETIAHAEHVDITKVRFGKPNAYGKVEEYYFSNDWKDIRKNYNKPVKFPAYDTENPVGSQLYVWKGYSQGMNVYPKPEYISGIGWCVLDYTIQNFHVNNAQNSFSPSMSIILSGPVPENQAERDFVWQEIKKQYGGSHGAGEVFLIWAPDGTESVKLEPIQNNNNDQKNLELAAYTTDMILTASQIVSPMLFGIKTAGQLGGRQELMDAYELFLNTTIKPVQKTFSMIFDELFGTPLIFVDSSPVAFRFQEGILEKILTIDEMRQLVGYEPMIVTEDTIAQETVMTENEVNEVNEVKELNKTIFHIPV